jgi:hypothetical protein
MSWGYGADFASYPISDPCSLPGSRSRGGERFLFAGVADPCSLFYSHTMEFRVLDLEREPIEFDLKLAPGAIDFGDEAVQMGDLATSGSAEVIHEHRGPKEVVSDIRLRGRFAGNSPGSLRALHRTRRNPARSRVRSHIPAPGRRCRRSRAVHYGVGDRNRLLSRGQSVA